MVGATGFKARGDFLICDQQAKDGITTALEVSAEIRRSGMSMNFTVGIRYLPSSDIDLWLSD